MIMKHVETLAIFERNFKSERIVIVMNKKNDTNYRVTEFCDGVVSAEVLLGNKSEANAVMLEFIRRNL